MSSTRIHELADYEEPVPKFYDSDTGRVEFGVRRLPHEAVLADISSYMGVYSTCNASLRKQSESASMSIDEHNDLTRAYPELIALARDTEASVSLWLLDDQHDCLKHARTQAFCRAAPRAEENEHGPAAEEGPLRFDPQVLRQNSAYFQLLRTSTPSELFPLGGERIIRIAVYFKPEHSGPICITGTVVLLARHVDPSSGSAGNRYHTPDKMWSVVWDNLRFSGVTAWLGFADLESLATTAGGLIPPPSSVVKAPGLKDEDENRPVLVVAWTCRDAAPTQQKPGAQGRGKGTDRDDAATAQPVKKKQEPPCPEWYVVSTVGTKNVKYEIVPLTDGESKNLGLGQTREEMKRVLEDGGA